MISVYLLLDYLIFHALGLFEARTDLGGKLVVTMDGGMIGRKMKMILTENDHDQMTAFLKF